MSDENNNEVRESLSSIATVETDSTDAYLSTFPPGYRFAPTDVEIVVHYLTTKVENKALPVNKINQVNLYDHTPEYLTSEIFKSYEDVWYYYTSRDRKYRNGERPNRSAGDGYWKATGVDKKIKTEEGTEVGSKKTLVFYRGKAPKGDKTDWIMHEFRVEQSQYKKNSRADMMLDNYVLCRIYNKGTTKSKTKRVQSEAEAAATPAQEETTPSTMEPMEYSNEEEERRALYMITDEPAATEIGPMSLVSNETSVMDLFAGSTFDDPLPITRSYHPIQCPTSPSHMEWGGNYYDSSEFSQARDYNDMMSSLSVNPQVSPPPMQGGNYDCRELFKENDNIFAATTAAVIPNYCQDYPHCPIFPHR